MRRNVIDRLALLCTLHADGPKTLRLLREAGCTTLDSLRDHEPNRLAKILSLSPAAARRLLREGAQLEERLEPALDREEVMYPPAEDSGAVPSAPPETGRVSSVPGTGRPGKLPAAARPPEAELTRRADLNLRDRRLLDQVVDRWRTADESSRRQVEADPLPREEPEPAEAHAAQEAEAREPEKVEKVVELPAQPPRPRLQPGDLNGLDQAVCEALHHGGISSLEELAACRIEDLVERSRLSFTRARTLQFLAGRRLARGEVRETIPERRSEERLSPAVPTPHPAPSTELGVTGTGPAGADGDEGVGGPFA